MSESKEYRNIFKNTFLFGFVQVFNIIVKVGLNKCVALILGPAGMGIISLFNNSINIVSTGAGLGISQSAVRDLSDARGTENDDKINLTLSFVKKIIRYTSLLGIILMAALSPLLSEYTFGNKDYTLSYLFLSLACGATIQTNGYRAINTGMRQLRNVALSTIWGAVAGLVTAVPLYYFFGDKGIVPSLIVSAFATLIIARYYADKIKFDKVAISLKEALKRSDQMIKMGISLMLMSLMLVLVQLIISSYISTHGGLDIVGLYQAGSTIITGYFGIIVTAMTTEYYPRISSFNSDNEKLKEAVNSQSVSGLILALPLIVLFTFLIPYFLEFLYSDKFLSASDFTDYAIFGTIMFICSNCMGMVLLAKQKSMIFLISSFLGCIFIVIINIVLYNLYGLTGLGIAYLINGIFQFTMYDLIMRHYFGINFDKKVFLILTISIVSCIAASFLRGVSEDWIRWSCGSVLLLLVSVFSIYGLQKTTGINIIDKIKSKFKR